jgi:hypothetical protein
MTNCECSRCWLSNRYAHKHEKPCGKSPAYRTSRGVGWYVCMDCAIEWIKPSGKEDSVISPSQWIPLELEYLLHEEWLF